VESHLKGKFYKVDLNGPSCTCPHFLIRMKKIGEECKHINAVKERYGKVKQVSLKNKNKSDKILDFVRKKGSADAMELIKKFGEKGVDDLIKRGDLIEERGVVKVLE